jgi:hypothetical protein
MSSKDGVIYPASCVMLLFLKKCMKSQIISPPGYLHFFLCYIFRFVSVYMREHYISLVPFSCVVIFGTELCALLLVGKHSPTLAMTLVLFAFFLALRFSNTFCCHCQGLPWTIYSHSLTIVNRAAENMDMHYA